MPVNLPSVDVAVVGLGAAGGVVVLPLARAGLKVAGIEAGTWMDPARDYHADEIYNNVRGQVTTGNKVAGERPTTRNSPNARAVQAPSHPMMNAIGGTSIHYHAQSWRFSPWDFRVRSRVVERYGAAAIPAGSTVEDWPISYDDLEPHYDIIEREIGVSGRAGNLRGQLTGRGNPFEGPRQNEFPMPPLRDSGFTDLMMKAGRDLGWRPFRGPAAINSQEYRGRPACGYHGYCDRGGCHLNAKNSTAITTIPEAQRTGNLEIFDMAHVTRIVSDDRTGRASGVLYRRNGEEYFQPAKAVLLGAYTYENVRLLLLSASAKYPRGLSNNAGQVGRHYFSHQMGAVSALFPFDLNTWYGAIAQGVVIDEWADDNFNHAELGFIGGASIHAYHERHPIAAASMNTWGRAPSWGSDWKRFIHENADRQTSAYIQCNTFPYENTYLDLDDTVRDPLGDPVIRITSPAKENEQRAAAHAAEKAREWYRAAGAIQMSGGGGGFGGGVSTHAIGGTRTGDDPSRNVVDRYGLSHEVPNLGIVGGSVMGTIGARNPTLTFQALAWRTGEWLAKEWGRIG